MPCVFRLYLDQSYQKIGAAIKVYLVACVHMWSRARKGGCSSIPFWRFGSAHRGRPMGAWGPHLEHQVAEWGVDRMAVTDSAGAQRTTLCPSPAAYVGQTSLNTA